MPGTTKSDVLIVGAGPAGLATAIAAASKGLRVTVGDARWPPINKPCGEGLLPEAVEALRAIGIHLDSSLGFSLHGFRFCDDLHSAVAPMANRSAFGVRRIVLHRLLTEKCAALGVRFRWGARVSDFAEGHARINGESHKFDWLVGADGIHSSVRRSMRFGRVGMVCRTRFGFRRHFAVVPWSKNVEVFWGSRFQLVVTPTNCNEVCVSFFTRDSQARIEQGLAEFSELAIRLKDAERLSSEQGTLIGLANAWQVASVRVALVGDASCSVDGIAGHGLSLDLQQALALADALARGDMRHYRAAHRRIIELPLRMTQLLLLMDVSTWIRRKTLKLFEAQPEVFGKIISVHTSRTEEQSFHARDLLNLSCRVLAA